MASPGRRRRGQRAESPVRTGVPTPRHRVGQTATLSVRTRLSVVDGRIAFAPPAATLSDARALWLTGDLSLQEGCSRRPCAAA